MNKIQFNEKWLFAHQSYEFLSAPTEEYKKVTLPYDAMIHEKRQKDLPGGQHTGYFPPGSYEFKKVFTWEPKWQDKKIQILFEGVYAAARIYVNHMYAGENINGYVPFVLDLTPYLQPGENEIRVDCRSYRDSRWYTGAGIYRNVYLLVSELTHIIYGKSSVVTKEISDDYAVIEAEVNIKNDSLETNTKELLLNIYNDQMESVWCARRRVTLFPGEEKNCRQRIVIDKPKLWSPDSPDLYKMQMILTDSGNGENIESELRGGLKRSSIAANNKLDVDEISFGIRMLSLNKREGLKINGQSVKLRGTCIHHDHGILGACEYQVSAYRKIRRLKEAGINAVRIAHHPASQEILDACDRLGMLVMNEAFDAWTVNKNPYDYALFFERDWENVIEKMVWTSRNHPSVILYSIGNEIIECGNPKGAQVAWQLNEKIKSMDPDRFTILCLNVLLCMMDERPHEEKQSKSKDVNAEMAAQQHVFKSLIVDPHISQKVEEALGYVDIVGYNYGDSRYLLDKEAYPDRILCGSETFSMDLAENWKLVQDNPQILGDFNWTGWDYLGEAGIGKMEYETSECGNELWKSAFCGDFDLNGNRRAQSYYRETVWGKCSHPWILVQHPEQFGKKAQMSPWAFFDGAPTWDFKGQEGKDVLVQIYSDADEVELLINGQIIGRKTAGKSVGFITEFSTIYKPGEVSAVAYRGGKKVSEWTISGGKGKPTLKVEQEIDLGVDSDIIYYSITNRYENGVVDRNTPIKVSIKVINGELLGFGSADPKSTENYFDSECVLYEGSALAVVRGNADTKVIVEKVAS